MVQACRSLRNRPRRAFRFRVVQNAAGSHPGADKHQQPGGCAPGHICASGDIRLRTQAKHEQEYCTLLETRIKAAKVPARCQAGKPAAGAEMPLSLP